MHSTVDFMYNGDGSKRSHFSPDGYQISPYDVGELKNGFRISLGMSSVGYHMKMTRPDNTETPWTKSVSTSMQDTYRIRDGEYDKIAVKIAQAREASLSQYRGKAQKSSHVGEEKTSVDLSPKQQHHGPRAGI